MLELNRIYNIDCLKGLRQLGLKQVKLAIADPPYNVGKDYGEGYNDNQYKPNYLWWCKTWFDELERVAELILITPGRANFLDWIINIKKPRDVLCHYKPNSTSHCKNGGWMRWEPILVYGKAKLKHTPSGDAWNVSISIQERGKNFPVAKSLRLWKILVKEFSDEGDLVLDPFMGSGTTAIACKLQKRNFIGFEINPEYCKIAEECLSHTHHSKDFKEWFNKSFH